MKADPKKYKVSETKEKESQQQSVLEAGQTNSFNCTGRIRKARDAIVISCLKLPWDVLICYMRMVWAVMPPFLYLFDVGSDGYASHQHKKNGDIYWAWLTISFIILPIFSQFIRDVIALFLNKDTSWQHKSSSVIRVICVSPIRPFYLIMDNTTTILRGQSDDSIQRVSFLNLQAVMLEAIPQTGLQCYAIMVKAVLRGELGLIIAPWQWVTVLTSIFSLAFTLSTNSFLFSLIPGKTKAAFFFICGITLYARLWVFVLYASVGLSILGNSSLVSIVPVVILLLVSIGIWIAKRFCLNPILSPVVNDNHNDTWTTWTTVIMTWLITAAFNGITHSGLLVGAVNLVLASPWIQEAFLSLSSGHILVGAVVTCIPSLLSVIINIFIIVVPSIRHIRQHWLNANAKGVTLLY